MSGVEQVTPGTVERIRPRQLSQRDPAGLAKAAAESGFWKHIKTSAQAMVVMAAGEELGLTPLASLQGITIIEGKVGYTGNLVATLMKQSPDHDYRVLAKTNERCELEFGPAPAPGRDADGEWLPWPDAYGVSEFTVEDAKRAELVKPRSNWVKYPRAMCFNRALTEGIRAYCPEITAGTPVYTDEEIREVIHVESEAEVVDAEPVTTLPAERVDHLLKGIELVEPALAEMSPQREKHWNGGLNLILGSIGANQVGLRRFREDIAGLSEEHADLLDAELQKLADQQAAEETDPPTDAEQSQEGGEAGADA